LNAKSTHVREKPPPIPNKQRKSASNAKAEATENIELNMLEETQDMENTVASIRLNESDLKELEDEFSFDEGEDDDENDTNEACESVNRKKSFGTNNTLVKRFDLLQTTNASGDDLIVIFLLNYVFSNKLFLLFKFSSFKERVSQHSDGQQRVQQDPQQIGLERISVHAQLLQHGQAAHD